MDVQPITPVPAPPTPAPTPIDGDATLLPRLEQALVWAEEPFEASLLALTDPALLAQAAITAGGPPRWNKSAPPPRSTWPTARTPRPWS
jgi:hypothetical protein